VAVARRICGLLRAASRARAIAAVPLALVLLALGPGIAQAHGPTAPVASDYLARITSAPAGLDAKVVDGDLRMWFKVRAPETVIVLDYIGAPYLRFSPAGVAVNENSEMYYLNQNPAEVPPAGLTAKTPPKWSSVSSGRTYEWHDGRLHAQATQALAPGSSYVGPWRVPVEIGDGVSAVSGGLWHRGGPSIVWFWPILVLLLCTLAARRVRVPEVNRRAARALAVPSLLAILTAGIGKQLHGRPGLSGYNVFLFAVIVAFVAWALWQVVIHRPGYITYFAIAFVSIYEGAQLAPTLVDGYVLAAVPALVARIAAVVCLGCGAGLLVLPARLSEPDAEEARSRLNGASGGARQHLERAA
jgi:hypothetical protein